jgi:hypothetical protein
MSHVMRKYLMAVIVGVSLVATSSFQLNRRPVAAETQQTSAVFYSDGKLKLPVGYRKWVFLGSPLTPNALNGGNAAFPEFHNVYVEQKNLDAYFKTGSFREGTVLVKELTRVLEPKFPDGSRTEPSGRGYFNGVFTGGELNEIQR